MMFRDRKTGQVFQNIEKAKANFCTGGPCIACPIGRANNETVYTCDIYARTFPRTAALKMGLEVLDGPAPSASAKEPPTRRSILRDAEKCVVGEREQDYGSPENSFAVIGKLWGIYLEEKCLRDGHITILPEDTAALMCLFKTARVVTGHGKTDNWVDLAGYAACGGEIEGGKK